MMECGPNEHIKKSKIILHVVFEIYMARWSLVETAFFRARESQKPLKAHNSVFVPGRELKFGILAYLNVSTLIF